MSMSEGGKLATGALITAVLATVGGVLAYQYLKNPDGDVPRRFVSWQGPELTVPRPVDLPITSGGDHDEGFVQFGAAPRLQRVDWDVKVSPEIMMSIVDNEFQKGELVMQAASDGDVAGHRALRRVVANANIRLLFWHCDQSERSFMLLVRAPPRSSSAEVDRWANRAASGTHCH